MKIDFLFRRVGLGVIGGSLSALAVARVGLGVIGGSLSALAVAFVMIAKIRNNAVQEYCYGTVVCVCLIMLPVLIALMGSHKTLRGEPVFKRVATSAVTAFAIICLTGLLPWHFGLFIPFAYIALFYALFYGIGGYIGYRIRKRKQTDLTSA